LTNTLSALREHRNLAFNIKRRISANKTTLAFKRSNLVTKTSVLFLKSLDILPRKDVGSNRLLCLNLFNNAIPLRPHRSLYRQRYVEPATLVQTLLRSFAVGGYRGFYRHFKSDWLTVAQIDRTLLSCVKGKIARRLHKFVGDTIGNLSQVTLVSTDSKISNTLVICNQFRFDL